MKNFRDGNIEIKTDDSEFVVRDGDIDHFRVCEAEYMTVKAYFNRFLGKHGKTCEDISYAIYHHIRAGRTNRRYTAEQFLKFSESYEWDGGEGYWAFMGDGFAVTSYPVWDFTAIRFTSLTGDPYEDSGTEYTGPNEFLDSVNGAFRGNVPEIRYAVLNGPDGRSCTVTGGSFSRPSRKLYALMQGSDSIAVYTDMGWAVIGAGMKYIADVTWFENPRYRPFPEAEGFGEDDTANHHIWLSEHTERPDTEAIAENVHRAMMEMAADGHTPPVSIGLLDCRYTECIFLVTDLGEDMTERDRLIRSYLQPHFGVFVHVFDRSELRYLGLGPEIELLERGGLRALGRT